jgi:hypothetical protein
MATEKLSYGVIAYIPTPGKFPRDDECHFDGWYQIREWAEAVFEDFRRRYPAALVHLVTNVKSDWRQQDRPAWPRLCAHSFDFLDS